MKTILLAFLFSFSSFAKLSVLTTTPDIAWLVKSIGGERVKVESLLNGTEDPHYVDALPHWIAKASRADMFCQVGLELEVGWVPKVLKRSGNSKIQSGGKGFCDIGKSISALEVPTGKLDRSMGDVHSGGNPHYHLGPDRYIEAANFIFETLINNDETGIETFDKNLRLTIASIKKTKAEATSLLKKSQKKKLMSYHKEFSYFVREFSLTYVGDIEETPGVPPSAGRIARVALEAKRKNVHYVLHTPNNPKKIIKKYQEISGVIPLEVPISIVKKGKPSNYHDLIMTIAKRINGETP